MTGVEKNPPCSDARRDGPAPLTGVVRNALHLLVGQGATTALSIVLSASLGRALGPADYGLWFLLWSMTAFAYDFVSWGQAAFLVRQVAREPDRSGVLLGSAVVFRLAAAAVVTLPAVAATLLLGYDRRTSWLCAALIAALIPLSLAQVFGLVFRGYERMDRDALVTAVAKALTVAAVIPALRAGGGIASIVAAHALGGIAALGLAAWLHRALALPPPAPTRDGVRELAIGGAPLVALGLGIGAQAYAETVLLSRLAPPEAVGFYGGAKNIMNLLVTPAAIMGMAAYPRLARAAGDVSTFRRELGGATRMLLWVGGLASAGTWLYADVAVGLVYGADRFAPAVPILKTFAPLLLLAFLDSLFASAVIAAGRPRELAIAKCASVLLVAALTTVLVPIFQARVGSGGMGVVVASGAGTVCTIVAILVLLPKQSLAPSVASNVVRAVVTVALTLAAGPALRWASPVLSIPACVVVFSATSWATGLVTGREVSEFGALVLGRRTTRPG
jgi:PST family polysaccharide transporter